MKCTSGWRVVLKTRFDALFVLLNSNSSNEQQHQQQRQCSFSESASHIAHENPAHLRSQLLSFNIFDRLFSLWVFYSGRKLATKPLYHFFVIGSSMAISFAPGGLKCALRGFLTYFGSLFVSL